MFVIDILQGLKHIHDKEYVHCDIKLDNLFLCKKNRKKIKIADFGLMQKKINGKIELKDSLGTYHYMAPELKIRNKQHIIVVDDKIDIYSLGVVVYKMACAYFPNQKKLEFNG